MNWSAFGQAFLTFLIVIPVTVGVVIGGFSLLRVIENRWGVKWSSVAALLLFGLIFALGVSVGK